MLVETNLQRAEKRAPRCSKSSPKYRHTGRQPPAMRLRPSNTGRQRALRRDQGCPGGPLSTPRRAACRPPAPLPGEKPPIPPPPGPTCAPGSPRRPGRLLPAASQARPGLAGLTANTPATDRSIDRSVGRSIRPPTLPPPAVANLRTEQHRCRRGGRASAAPAQGLRLRTAGTEAASRRWAG